MLLLLAGTLATGCAAPMSQTNPTPTQSQTQTLLEQARTATQAGDHENAALTLRGAVEVMARETPDSPELEAARARCAKAMVEAGGNRASFQLWTDLAQKNPSSTEAKRMVARARSLMLQQAEELRGQAKLDADESRPQAALCTAIASRDLLEEAGGTSAEKTRAKKLIQDLSASLRLPPDASPALRP